MLEFSLVPISLAINLVDLFLAEALSSLKLSLHFVKGRLQAVSVIRLDLADEADVAAVAYKHLPSPFRLAAFTNYLRQHTVASDMGHMSVETLVKLAISALIDTGSGLNKAFPPMSECLIEGVHFLTINCLASGL